eukprot:gnl/Chilomastix_cuspidata/3194.p1 GENE.gnl/Chilomastix_cuspidata/3194~~gnl/Chilomastix_cuspidata/3194.p1  ORF type:complete len:490 (+),score=147.41 gnl/Chilomastix_cuspidata/3194:37-1506(+)
MSFSPRSDPFARLPRPDTRPFTDSLMWPAQASIFPEANRTTQSRKFIHNAPPFQPLSVFSFQAHSNDASAAAHSVFPSQTSPLYLTPVQRSPAHWFRPHIILPTSFDPDNPEQKIHIPHMKKVSVMCIHNLPHHISLEMLTEEAKFQLLPPRFELTPSQRAAFAARRSPRATTHPFFAQPPANGGIESPRAAEKRSRSDAPSWLPVHRTFTPVQAGWLPVIGYAVIEEDEFRVPSVPGTYSAYVVPLKHDMMDDVELRIRQVVGALTMESIRAAVLARLSFQKSMSIPVPTSPTEQLIVKNVPYDVTDAQIEALLAAKEIGGVKSINRNKNNKGKFTGLLYFAFASVEAAIDAFFKLSHSSISERQLRVEFRRTPASNATLQIHVLLALLRDPDECHSALAHLQALEEKGIIRWEPRTPETTPHAAPAPAWPTSPSTRAHATPFSFLPEPRAAPQPGSFFQAPSAPTAPSNSFFFDGVTTFRSTLSHDL